VSVKKYLTKIIKMELIIKNQLGSDLKVFLTPASAEIDVEKYFKNGIELSECLINLSKKYTRFNTRGVNAFVSLFHLADAISKGYNCWEIARKFVDNVNSISTRVFNRGVINAASTDNLKGYITTDGLTTFSSSKYINVSITIGNLFINIVNSSPSATIDVHENGATSSDGMSYPWVENSLFNLSNSMCFNCKSEKYWFFNDSQCWSKEYGNHDVKGPFNISNEFPNLPSNIDGALFNYKSEKYWFFKGSQCWSKEYGNPDITGPFNISDEFPNLPSNIDGALFNYKSEKYWFFKGSQCWSKEYGNHNVKGPFNISDEFPNLPSNIDGALFNYKSEKYWFFKSGLCWSKEYGNHDIKGPWKIEEQFKRKEKDYPDLDL
jgi:Hemopexin